MAVSHNTKAPARPLASGLQPAAPHRQAAACKMVAGWVVVGPAGMGGRGMERTNVAPTVSSSPPKMHAGFSFAFTLPLCIYESDRLHVVGLRVSWPAIHQTSKAAKGMPNWRLNLVKYSISIFLLQLTDQPLRTAIIQKSNTNIFIDFCQ